MRVRQLFRRFSALLVVAVLGGCGDGGTDILDDLTEAEAAQLLTALTLVWIPSPTIPSATPTTLARAPETTLLQDTTQTSVACPSGGTAQIASIDSLSITVDSRLNPSSDTTFATNTVYGGRTTTTTSYLGCGASGGGGGVWSFDADPGLTLTYEIDGSLDSHRLTDGTSFLATSVGWSGQWSGSIGWSNGGRSGTCSVALTMESQSSNDDGQISSSFSQSGQICGLDVSTGS